MKSIYTSVFVILAAIVLVGSIGASLQQTSAIIIDGGKEFKELTKQFEKDVLDAASVNPPDRDKIQQLLDDYSDDVMELFREPSTSP